MTDRKRRRVARSLALLLAAAGAGAPGEAAADDAEVRSRGLFAQGEALANHGTWKEACPLFQAAHDLHGTGGTALRAADCYEKIGKYDRALALYQYIVDHRDTDKMPDRVTLAEGRVGALKKQLGPEPPVRPAPMPMAPAPIQAPPPPPPSKVPAYVAFGGGGVGLVVGAAFGGLALQTASDVRAVCGPGPNCPHPGERSAASAAKTEAWVSNAGFFVAIAGAVTGTVLLMVKVSPAQKSAVGSAFGPGGLTLRF